MATAVIMGQPGEGLINYGDYKSVFNPAATPHA